MTYSKERIKFSNQKVYWYFYIVGLGKTGSAHYPLPLPHKMFRCFFLSFSLLDYTTLSLYLNTYEWSTINQTNKFIPNCGMGKDWAGPFFPSSKIFYLSIDQLVFRFMLLFHCILTLMNDLFQRENQVFKPNILFVLLHCGVGKDWAGPFSPPPPLQNVLIFLFIFRTFSLCYSFTVSEDLWMR